MRLLDALRTPSRARRRLLAGLYAVYVIVVVSLLVVPAMLPQYIDDMIQNNMQDTYEYHLVFYGDGYQKYYYLERWDTGAIARVVVNYTTSTNVMRIDRCENARVLELSLIHI
mgnify:CR=1 FL=1